MSSRAEKAAEYAPIVDDIALDFFGWAMTPEHVAELEARRDAYEAEAAEEWRRIEAEIHAADRAAGRPYTEVYL